MVKKVVLRIAQNFLSPVPPPSLLPLCPSAALSLSCRVRPTKQEFMKPLEASLANPGGPSSLKDFFEHGRAKSRDSPGEKRLRRKASRAKFWRNVSPTWAKNAAKKWRIFSPIFVLQFPGKVVARNFTKNWRQIRLVVK